MDRGWAEDLLRICLRVTDKLRTGNCISYWVDSWWGRRVFYRRAVETGQNGTKNNSQLRAKFLSLLEDGRNQTCQKTKDNLKDISVNGNKMLKRRVL
jgi:hypothetical protein